MPQKTEVVNETLDQSTPEQAGSEVATTAAPEAPKKDKAKGGKPKQEKGGKAKEKHKVIPRAQRPVMFPKFDVREYTKAKGRPMTAEIAKEILGWEVVDKKSEDYHFTDQEGNKIFLRFNAGNRPLNESWALALAYDILNRHWRFNGETVIRGKSGDTLSGQHRLIGLVFAEQIRTGKNAPHWEALWSGPIEIDMLVAEGIEEDDATLRTLDNTRPRTLTDVLCTEAAFQKYGIKQRKELGRMIDYCLRFLWKRTGMKDTFHRYMTHSEALAFMQRHPHVLKAVQHIYEEDGGGEKGEGTRISGAGKWVGAGYAAGLLYLMGSSKSDIDSYTNPKMDRTTGLSERSEKGMDWSLWEQACDFWTLLAGGEDEFAKILHSVTRPIMGESGKEQARVFMDAACSLEDKLAHLAKAWEVHLSGEKPTKGLFKLHYEESEDGGFTLMESASCGGIDEGTNPAKKSPEKDVSEEENEGPGANDPSPEEIASMAGSMRAARSNG